MDLVKIHIWEKEENFKYFYRKIIAKYTHHNNNSEHTILLQESVKMYVGEREREEEKFKIQKIFLCVCSRHISTMKTLTTTTNHRHNHHHHHHRGVQTLDSIHSFFLRIEDSF